MSFMEMTDCVVSPRKQDAVLNDKSYITCNNIGIKT